LLTPAHQQRLADVIVIACGTALVGPILTAVFGGKAGAMAIR